MSAYQADRNSSFANEIEFGGSSAQNTAVAAASTSFNSSPSRPGKSQSSYGAALTSSPPRSPPRSSPTSSLRTSPRISPRASPHRSQIVRHHDWWSPSNTNSESPDQHGSRPGQASTPSPKRLEDTFQASPFPPQPAASSPYTYYSAYASGQQHHPEWNSSGEAQEPARERQEQPGASRQNIARSPGHHSIRSVQSADLEECASDNSPAFDSPRYAAALMKVNEISHESTPDFQEAPESLGSTSYSHLAQGFTDAPYLPAEQSYPDNEIRREAQSVQPLTLSESDLAHRPDPVRQSYYEYETSYANSMQSADQNSSVEKLNDDDDEHDTSILNSLPTPRVPSAKIESLSPAQSLPYPTSDSDEGPMGPPSGAANGPVSERTLSAPFDEQSSTSQAPFTTGLPAGVASESPTGPPTGPPTGSLEGSPMGPPTGPVGPATGPATGPAGPVESAPTGPTGPPTGPMMGFSMEPSLRSSTIPVFRPEYSHSPQASQSSNSDGSWRSRESRADSDSPRLMPQQQRPRSTIQSNRASRRQSYYDFGNGSSAASLINLNLTDAVAKEQGQSASSLMSRMKTIELYRKSAKKSNDPDLEFQLAQYMMQTALIASSQQAKAKNKTGNSLLKPGRAGSRGSIIGHSTSSSAGSISRGSSEDLSPLNTRQSPPASASLSKPNTDSLSSGTQGSENGSEHAATSAKPNSEIQGDITRFTNNLFRDSISSLKRLSDRGYADAQYLLGDIYSSTALNNTPDMEKSFKYFSMAGKHNHAEAAYRAALCLQEGWGTARDARRAIQFLKSAAVRNQPGALYQLGMAYFYGGMGIPDNSANRQAGVKWLSRAVNVSDTTFNRAPYELAKIFEVGYKDLVIPDGTYAAKLYSRSAELGFVPAAARLGKAYEFGELGCPQDASLSIHYFTIAALGNDPTAQLAMCAWYMVGAGPTFPVSCDEAYEWCLRAALNGLPKAQHMLAYFLENGIGVRRNIIEASKWYRKAAANGYEKAQKRVKEMGLAEDDQPKGKCAIM